MPRSLYKVRVKHFLPSVEALDVAAIRDLCRDSFPILTLVLFDCSFEELILLLGPVALVIFALLVLGRPSLVHSRVGPMNIVDAPCQLFEKRLIITVGAELKL